MDIIENLIPCGQGIRTCKKLTRCQGLVIHWIGVNQPKADVIRSNFAREECGTHYICDYLDGHIIRCVPEDEVCYHVGGNSYTDLKRCLVGDKNPNWYFVGVECCISEKDKPPADYAVPGRYMDLGKPSEAQYTALVELAADFLTRHNMSVDHLYRHYDITGKVCHAWFVKDKARWDKFKTDVKSKMEGKEEQPMEQEQFNKLYRNMMAEVSERPVSVWASDSWKKACGKKVFDGTAPGAFLTREQGAVVLDRLGLLEEEGTAHGDR